MSTKIPENFYVNLGNSGLKISKVILGCMTYGTKTWADWVIEDEEEVFAIMKSAYDSGIRTFDTLNVYSGGVSEILIGKFIKKFNIPREDLVIMTKCYGYVAKEFVVGAQGSPFDVPFINKQGLSRKHIMAAVADSIERLGTYIDVLQIHRYDKHTPPEETMRALNDVVASGDVRYIGASSMWTHEFIELQTIAEKNGWAKFISMQNFYCLLYREEEREMIPYCKKTGVGLIPWSPIAGGVLAKPILESDSTSRSRASKQFFYSVWANENNREVINKVEKLSKKYDVSMAVIASAWVIAKGGYPIIGVSKLDRVADAVKALEVELSEEDINYIDEGYQSIAVVGHQ